MKKHHILIAWAFTGLLSLGLISCISDDSEAGDMTGNSVPTLTIEGTDTAEMPTYNLYLGNECVINPQISYSGSNENDLKYSWKIGTYANGVKGELEEVSTERNLHYTFDKGGSYYAHFTATDGKVGKAVDYKINVNRTFEEGYVLTTTNSDGKGNLTFVKILTPEEIAAGQKNVIMENCMEKMNEGVSEQGLLASVIKTFYINYPKQATRLCVSTDKTCYVLDPNNLTILTQINYEELYPGFKATHFINDSYAPYAYDAKMKKFAHIDLTYLFPYEKDHYLQCHAEDFIVNKYVSWGSENLYTFYLDYTNNKVAMYSSYAPYFGLDTYFPDTENLLEGNTLITAFYGDQPGSNYVTPTYFITRENSTGNIVLWTNYDDSYFYTASNFKCQTITPTDNTAVPERNTTLVASTKQQRYYYSLGNSIYVFLPKSDFALPEKSQYAIEYNGNEEVTFLDVNLSTDEMYVGTYDNSTKRGSFYIYDCKDVRTDNAGGVTPKAAYKNCAGRISGILYKPSVQ